MVSYLCFNIGKAKTKQRVFVSSFNSFFCFSSLFNLSALDATHVPAVSGRQLPGVGVRVHVVQLKVVRVARLLRPER